MDFSRSMFCCNGPYFEKYGLSILTSVPRYVSIASIHLAPLPNHAPGGDHSACAFARVPASFQALLNLSFWSLLQPLKKVGSTDISGVRVGTGVSVTGAIGGGSKEIVED